jgi:hypothetical protein
MVGCRHAGGVTAGHEYFPSSQKPGPWYHSWEFVGGDNDGMMIECQGGKLEATLPGSCHIGVVFGINKHGRRSDAAAAARRRGISWAPALRRADARLYELTVYFSKKRMAGSEAEPVARGLDPGHESTPIRSPHHTAIAAVEPQVLPQDFFRVLAQEQRRAAH